MKRRIAAGAFVLAALASEAGSLVERFGRYGNYHGQFVAVYSVAIGPDGAVYVADADGKRVQKFIRGVKP